MAVRQRINSMRLLKLWLPVVVCCSTILYFSILPGDRIRCFFPYQDLVFHFFVYAILGYFFIRAAEGSLSGLSQKRLVLISVLFCFFYGGGLEFYQLYVPGRNFSGLDMLINAAGACSGSLTYR